MTQKPMGKTFFDEGLCSNDNSTELVLQEAEELFHAQSVSCIVSLGTRALPKVTLQKPTLLQQTLSSIHLHHISNS